MPRLVAIDNGVVVRIAFGVKEEASRSETDQTLIDEWSSQYDAVVFVEDPEARVEIDDEWASSRGVQPITARKTALVSAINFKTKALISSGYEWPAASSHVFSLSETAQRNLGERDKIRATLTYPLKMSTKSDDFVYSVQSEEELHAMYLTALARISVAYAGGNDLKERVHAATTHAALDAIVDER
jgi:hypothetical protein